MSEAIVEKPAFFEVLVNHKGEIAFAIPAYEGEPENPCLLFDGQNSAILYRKPDMSVKLDDIHPTVCEMLQDKQQVLIIEISDTKAESSYNAVMKTKKRLPS